MQFDNMQALIVSFLDVKMPIHAPKMRVCGKTRENEKFFCVFVPLGMQSQN